jgi:hypothetical protein
MLQFVFSLKIVSNETNMFLVKSSFSWCLLFEEVLETEGEHQKSKTVLLTFSETASLRVFRFVISKHDFSVFNIYVLIRFPPNSLLGFNPNTLAIFLSEAGSLISSPLTDAVNTFMVILESSFLIQFWLTDNSL